MTGSTAAPGPSWIGQGLSHATDWGRGGGLGTRKYLLLPRINLKLFLWVMGPFEDLLKAHSPVRSTGILRSTWYFRVPGKGPPGWLTGAWHLVCRFLPFSSSFLLLPDYIPMGEKAAAFSPHLSGPSPLPKGISFMPHLEGAENSCWKMSSSFSTTSSVLRGMRLP